MLRCIAVRCASKGGGAQPDSDEELDSLDVNFHEELNLQDVGRRCLFEDVPVENDAELDDNAVGGREEDEL